MGRSTRFAAACAALIFGCADSPARERRVRDAGSDAGRDAGADEAGAADASSALDAASDAGAPPNDSFETARPIDLNGPLMLNDVTRPSEVDYFSFAGEAGAFYALSTDRHTFSPDTVIALFDPKQQPLAENDDGPMWPGDKLDSRLVVRLQASGTYFVRVQNHLGDSPVTPPVYYHLTIKRLMPGTAGVTLQKSASPAQVQFAHDAMSGYAYATAIGDFAAVKAAAFELQGQAEQILVGHVLPFGAHGNGSTAHAGAIGIADAAKHVVARIDGTKQQETFHPPLGDALYRLGVELDGDAGKNAFFAIDLVMLPDNPSELAEDANGVLDGAESLDLKAEMFRRRGLLLSRLAQDDVDYYRFDAPSPSSVTLACEGQSGGSGVLGLHAELRDDGDTMLAAADETPDASLVISGFALSAAGTYYVRLSSQTKTSKAAVEPWARCVVIARP